VKLKDIRSHITSSLIEIYPDTEVRGIERILVQDLLCFSMTDVLINGDRELNDEQSEKIASAIARMKSGEPVQHIIGKAHFYGRDFKVTNETLIPRQETEELVDLIIKEAGEGETVLDIGTGTGCIPITLAKELVKAKVMSCDISKGALAVANENARLHKGEVEFRELDFLSEDKNSLPNYSIIVSNPPYIRISEKSMMHKNVLDFEPDTALFVDDADPLLFYREITAFASNHLDEGGKLYFEINEAFGAETANLLLNSGFTNVEVVKDINGKDRIVKGAISVRI